VVKLDAQVPCDVALPPDFAVKSATGTQGVSHGPLHVGVVDDQGGGSDEEGSNESYFINGGDEGDEGIHGGHEEVHRL